ncbi:MAG: response regulator transcription factor [Fusobacteriota bacterium]
MKILIIEDDKILSIQLEEVLIDKGHKVSFFESGIDGFEFIIKEKPDLIILDLGLPDLNGEDICHKICKDIPVIIISGFSDPEKKQRCYSKGCIDYIEKPIKLKNFANKITNLENFINRNSQNNIKYKNLIINLEEQKVENESGIISLTFTEYSLLTFLIEKQGRVLTRENILKNIWKDNYLEVNDRVVDKTIHRLKNKVMEIEENLESKRGIGYKLIKD